MTTAVAKRESAAILERVVIQGDLSQLTPEERVAYYNQVCQSLDLNPLTKPFDYIKLSGKLTLYAKKDCADQLRNKHNISIRIVHREDVDGIYEVTARASKPDGREDEDVGAVSVKGLTGDAMANARMKATTKAKRRVTLSICGLGFLDESELETIADVRPADNSAPQQLEHKPSDPPAKPNGKHAISGKELEQRIIDHDAKLAGLNICKPKELLKAVSAAGEALGWSWSIAEWPEGGFQVAVDAVKAFEAERQPQHGRKVTKKNLLALESWLGKLHLTSADEKKLCSQYGKEVIADLTDAQASEMIGELAAEFAENQQANMSNPVPAAAPTREPGDDTGIDDEIAF